MNINPTSNTGGEIRCKMTSWFLWRALLMAALFFGFAGYFYYDGKIGYKEQNAQYYKYMGYLQAKKHFKEDRIAVQNGGEAQKTGTAEQWADFVNNYDVKVFEGHALEKEVTELDGTFPEGFVFPQKIPQVFADGYSKLLEDPEGGGYAIWKDYTSQQKLEISAKNYFHSRSKIENQFNWSIGSAVLGLVALFFLIRTMRRSMLVDQEGYTAPNGVRIPYGSITCLDKRKWARKGLAYVFYKDEARNEAKARVDGMCYGQFDPENPQNAENLFQQLEANLPPNAEIVDYADDDDEEDSGVQPEGEQQDMQQDE